MESAWTQCEVANDGSRVDIGASDDDVNSPPTESGGFARPTPDHPANIPAPAPTPTEPACDDPAFCNRSGFEVATFPDVTLADLASFRPASPTLAGEPEGFGVVGMPTNVVAAASEQVLPGTILGWDVVVRFTPAAYVFDYGDGSTLRTATGGATWPQLGQAQFTPTDTSHVYRSRGTYPVTVAVEYSASVDFGNGWRPVAGYVTASTGGYDVRVVEVRTALVDRTCLESPSGPGC